MQTRIQRIVETLRNSSLPTVEGIHPEDIFRAILKHERAVAERNSHIFTILAFYSEADPIDNSAAQALGRILVERLRATDLIGWLDSRTIGVILPETRGKDAAMVADQICRKMKEHQIKLGYKLYLYPNAGYGWPGAGDWPPSATRGVDDITPAGDGHVPVAAGTEPRRHAPVCAFSELGLEPFPFWKRLLDIGLCLFGLLVFGPLMLVIALGIKVMAPGPVIFKQERVGYRGKSFLVYKFRSMHLNADTGVHKEHLARLMASNATLTKLDQTDTRLIPFGKLFRASGLDELPQLFNILRGDMSFIGPRPCVPYEYAQLIPWHKHRFDTYPGLTGLWQVSGKNRTTFTEMMRLDIAYGQRLTLFNDFRILFKTIPAVLGQIRDCSPARRGL